MSTMIHLSREELRRHVVETYRQGSGSRPEVLRVAYRGEVAVLKDQAGADRWFACLIGPLLTWRETRALRELYAIRGVPCMVRKVGARALLMEYLESVPVRRSAERIDWPEFVPRLAALIDAMHACGVAHCDLRSPDNVLIDTHGEPVVVDFVACVFKGARWNLPWHWVFQRFCAVDRSALTKLKRRYAPQLLIADEAVQQRESAFERAARNAGVAVRRLSRVLFTRRG